jgi:prepilin-type N-terminal cleavage/methylation domain-containing protein
MTRAMNGVLPVRVSRGFSLIEVVVGIVLFAVVMSAVGALSLSVSRQAVDAWGAAQRSAVATRLVNDLSLADWATLAGRAGCTVVLTGPFPRRECISVSDVSANVKRVAVTIDPDRPGLATSTLYFERARPPAANAFNHTP